MAKIIDTSQLDQLQLSPDENHWVYNGLDNCLTLEIFNELSATIDETARRTYEFSLALQAPVLEMNMRGVLINQNRRRDVIRDFERKQGILEAQLSYMLGEVFDLRGFNWASPLQVKNLLYEVMQLPVQKKRNANGIYAPSSDREALEALSFYYIAEPIINHILGLRDLGKSLGFLRTPLDSDGRLRTSFNIAGTVTGRFSSSADDFDVGCVRPTAEALTPFGWKKLGDLVDGDSIAQWDKGRVTFVPATFFWTDFDGDLLEYKTEQVSLAVTPDHRVLSHTYRGQSSTVAAKEAARKAVQLIPVAGRKGFGTVDVPAYAAMLMADASQEETHWRVAFKKSRKIDRMKALLDIAEVPYSKQEARLGYERFKINADPTLPKKWGPWVLDLTHDSALALVKEAAHWDAHIRGKSFIFYNADKSQAEWFQTLANLVGFGTTMNCQINSDEAYGNNSWIYCVNVKPRANIQVMKKHWHKVPYTGKVGCPQVPSSYWLVRENGFISVTGNTNLQNITESLRSVFVADPGYKFANLDLEQGDSRNVGAICWELFHESHGETFAGAYLDACESGDLHTIVTKMVQPQLPWDGVNDKAVAETDFYRGSSYRQASKKLGHGSNYLGQPGHMAKQSKFPVANVKEFQAAYFGAFPCIPAWHKNVFWKLSNLGYIETLFGDRRVFFGRPEEAATRREAVAHAPQSMTGKEINIGILNLWRANRVQLLIQVHDSILFQFPEEQEDEIIPWALEALKAPLALSLGREFVVPTEAKVGWTWGSRQDWTKGDFAKGLCSGNQIGQCKNNNPDGLIKWKGHDSRTRTETRFKPSIL